MRSARAGRLPTASTEHEGAIDQRSSSLSSGRSSIVGRWRTSPSIHTRPHAHGARARRTGVHRVHKFVTAAFDSYLECGLPEEGGLLGARTEPLSALARIFMRCTLDAIGRRVDAALPRTPVRSSWCRGSPEPSRSLLTFTSSPWTAHTSRSATSSSSASIPGPHPDDILDLGHYGLAPSARHLGTALGPPRSGTASR